MQKSDDNDVKRTPSRCFICLGKDVTLEDIQYPICLSKVVPESPLA